MSRPLRILVIGASGFVGRHLAGRLSHDGHEVTVAGRDPTRLARRLPGLATCACDLASDEAADWLPRLAGIDAVVNCAGLIRDAGGSYTAVHDRGARALFDACRASGVARVVQVSALGADAAATTTYHRSKRAADDHLAELDPAGREMDWVVIRPSLIVGRGGQSTALFATLAALPMPLRLGPGRWMLQPIHVDDLVQGIARLLARTGTIAARIDAVGPEAMTTDAITLAMRRWLGVPRAPMLPIPRAFIAVAAEIGQVVGLGAITPESLAMLVAGNTADVAPFVVACGFRPASLATALSRTPATSADLLAARLLPLAPMLRVLLALVWLAGGLVPLVLTPRDHNIALLAQTGIIGPTALLTLVAASLLDIAIGTALLARFRVRAIALAAIIVMAGYSAILAIAFPLLWADPFGPLVKNAAVLGLALAVGAAETDHE